MSLHSEMERIGRILAADAGIQVCVRGSKAYATPGKIVLPALDTFAQLGQAAERMMQGLLDHEVGHAIDTDFVAWKALESESSFLRAVTNALEDGVIEARQGARYRGAAQNLRLKNEWYWSEQIGKVKPAVVRIVEEPFLVAFVLALTLTVRVHGGKPIETFAALRPHLGGLLLHCKPELDALAALYGESKVTPRVIQLARAVVKKAKAWPPEVAPKPRSKRPLPPLPPPPEKGAPEPSEGDGEPEDGETFDEGEEGPPEGDSEPEPEPDAEGDDSEPEPDAEGDDSEPEPDAEGDDSEPEPDAEGDDSEPESKPKGDGLRTWEEDATISPEDAVKQQIEAKIEELYGDEGGGYLVESHEWDIELDLTEQLPQRTVLAKHDTLVDLTRGATDALAQTFEASLRAMRELWRVHGADHGEVDPALLGEYAVGSASPDTIYQQYLAVDDRDVTVAVLVDCSGSMAGAPAEMATQGAIAMTRALAQCGVTHEVCGFTTWDVTLERATDASLPWLLDHQALREARRVSLRAARAEMQAAGDDPEFYARTFHDSYARVPVHAVFKSYGSSDTRGLLNIGGYQQNLDGEAVLWQARRLAARPEARRIMFVLSDGMPIGGRSNAATAQHLRDVLKQVLDAGIEVYAIGIRSMHVQDLFPAGQWWVVRDLGELAQVAVTALTEALTNGRTERKWIKID